MRTQTTGRALVLTGLGIILAGATISALWTSNPNTAVWKDWLAVAVWWFASVGLYAVMAYAVWVDVKPRQRWFRAVATGVLIVSAILFFAVGPAIADFVALLGISVAAAISYWSARLSRL